MEFAPQTVPPNGAQKMGKTQEPQPDRPPRRPVEPPPREHDPNRATPKPTPIDEPRPPQPSKTF
jgi:hypothetical protein